MNCRHCGTKLEQELIDLGSQPPSNSYLTSASLDKKEVYFPLRVYVCHKCFLTQTADFADRELFFNSDYAYFSSTSETWLAHANAYVSKVIQEFRLSRDSFVLEIASNDGYLLKNFVSENIPCLGVEPSESTAIHARQLGVETLVEFYGTDSAEKIRDSYGKADLIICNNVYAHVPDINDFTNAIETSLSDNGVVTIEFPHLKNLIEKCQFDTIYHEHYSYLSVSTVSKIFSLSKLRIFRVEKLTTHGGSVRIFGCKEDSSHLTCESVNAIIKEEEEIGLFDIRSFSQFQSRAEAIKMDLLDFLITAKREGKKVCGYGAAAKGNTLLNYAGIKPDLLPFVSDAAHSKIGKWLPGSRIPIVSPTDMSEFQPDCVVILPWNIAEEVKLQMSPKLPKTQFISFVPKYREV